VERGSPDPAAPEPTDPEARAAWLAAKHANTPTVAHLDTLGRTCLTIVHNRFERNGAVVDESYPTHVELDIEGNQRAITDALGRKVMTYDYDMLSTKIHQVSVDAGERWMLNDMVGKPIYAWDSRDHQTRYEYDALHRPTNVFVRTGSGAEKLAERTTYGEVQSNAVALNLRGKLFQQCDGAGVVTHNPYDFKGSLLSSGRQLLQNYKDEVDWTQSSALENETFTSSTTYDALNRPVTLTMPDASVIRPTYNEANLLEQVHVNLRGAPTVTPFVTNLDYNAKGQRELVEYGNGASTTYEYDPETFRLSHLKTTRASDNGILQDLYYTYDPIGNITAIRDDAQQTIYFNNQVVTPSTTYIYDAIYRLTSATGREHIGQASQPQTTFDDALRMHQPLPTDGQAMRNYGETYQYDAVGNMLAVMHTANNGNWTRAYAYDEPNSNLTNNRLTSTTVGSISELYIYDAHGNMTHMPHLPLMEWDFKDQLHITQQQAVNNGSGEKTYYVYDATGQRVRKVTERANGTKKQERIYVGGFEVYREYDGGGATLEREALHVMDDQRRVALVETKTIDMSAALNTVPNMAIRYQFDNHLGSACLELDESAAVISYEEYYPYGSTSYQAGRSVAEVSLKRYRYARKERDEGTGLNYYGARYYSPWLGRWTSSDPGGSTSLNRFVAFSNNPTNRIDLDGREDKTWLTALRTALRIALPVSVLVRGDSVKVDNFAKQVLEGVSRYEESLPDRHLSDYLKDLFSPQIPTMLIPPWGVRPEQLPFAGFSASSQEFSKALQHGNYATATESLLRAREQFNRGMETVTTPLTLLLAPEAAPESLGRELEASAANRLSSGAKLIRGGTPLGTAPSASKFVPSWNVTLRSQSGWWGIRIGELSEAEMKLMLDMLESKEVILGRSFNVKDRGMFVLDTWLKENGIQWSQRWQDVYNKAIFTRTSTGQPVNVMAGGGYTLGEVTAAEAGAQFSEVPNKPYWSSQPLGNPTWFDKLRQWLR
jgi:RHS repeat-associated protein